MDAMICDCVDSRYGLAGSPSAFGRDGVVDGAADSLVGAVADAGFTSDAVVSAVEVVGDGVGAPSDVAADVDGAAGFAGGVAVDVGAVVVDATTTDGPGVGGAGEAGASAGDGAIGVTLDEDEDDEDDSEEDNGPEGSFSGSTTLGFSARRSLSRGNKRLVRSSCCTSRSRTDSIVLFRVTMRPSRLTSTSRRFARNASISRCTSPTRDCCLSTIIAMRPSASEIKRAASC